ncbi:MAG: CoA ester lyase [Planktomarina sp.]|nr:CoA ester lyase [Planktomarina sp.]
MISRPYRSVLYIPGGREGALNKARNIPADAIIFDLEDAVAVTEKVSARATLVQQLLVGGYGRRTKIVRINSLETPWGFSDIVAVAGTSPDVVLLPKVDTAKKVLELRLEMSKYESLNKTKIWAMMETPRGILNAVEIADCPDLDGMVMGTNDLAKDLNVRFDSTRSPILTALGLSILAAKAAGIIILDGVFNAFKDDAGLMLEAVQGRDLGFDGKTLIHPAQVDIVNNVFSPSPIEIELAHRQIEAFKEASLNGEGVAVVDGKIVENLHIETARATIEKLEVILDMERTI